MLAAPNDIAEFFAFDLHPRDLARVARPFVLHTVPWRPSNYDPKGAIEAECNQQRRLNGHPTSSGHTRTVEQRSPGPAVTTTGNSSSAPDAAELLPHRVPRFKRCALTLSFDHVSQRCASIAEATCPPAELSGSSRASANAARPLACPRMQKPHFDSSRSPPYTGPEATSACVNLDGTRIATSRTGDMFLVFKQTHCSSALRIRNA